MSVCLAHFVVTAEATVDDLERLFSCTPSNLVVVSYQDWSNWRAVEGTLEQAMHRLNGGEVRQWHELWLRPGAIFGKTSRISSVEQGVRIAAGHHRFISVKCQVEKSPLSASGSVRLGLFASAKDAGAYPDGWMRHVFREIEEAQVRYICGVFWCGKEETETLFKRLRVCKDGMFFQPFWIEEPQEGFNDDEFDAAAARFDMIAKNARLIAVFPAYLMVLGPFSSISRPGMWDAPKWDGKLFPCGSSTEKGFRALPAVPQLPEKDEGAFGDALPLLKQKKAPLDRWKKGVHQLLIWVGYSRPSKKSAHDSQVWHARKRARRG